MAVLVTGGCGYIGSHTVLELLLKGYEVVVLDNLSNSSKAVLNRIFEITGKSVSFVQGDICDSLLVNEIFREYDIELVMHFAGLKAVGESVENPLAYYKNNVVGSLSLIEGMTRAKVGRLIFSSSATVYGTPENVPVREDFPRCAANPYGRTKLIVEDMLSDWCECDLTRKVTLLRYFNPVGAHPSGKMGEAPCGIPNNLVPYIAQVALGRRRRLQVFGDNYDTPDGTGVRDYIHVVDLAKGHLSALSKLELQSGLVAYNLGTGQGYSVLEVIRAFERASNREVYYDVVERRPGDVAKVYADSRFAKKELGWVAENDLDTMMADTWRWQLNNPYGYEEDKE